MDGMQAAKVEAMCPGVIIIDSYAPGLKYLFDSDKSRMVIAGEKGCTMLSMTQARALRDEISDIIEQSKYFTLRATYNDVGRNKNDV